jgi:hypothetical protein
MRTVMRIAAVATMLAVAAAALCVDATAAFAGKMNGRCCQWLDGGRSFGYRFATIRTEFPSALRVHAVSCINRSWNSMDVIRSCLAGSRARAVPLSGRQPTATQGI